MLVDAGNVTMVICVPSVAGALTQQVNAWVATDAHHPWRRVSCGMIPTGKGHYNAAIPAFKYSKVNRTNAIASIKSCRCGINKKSAATESCKPCPIYTTRCKCYKESWPCNALCQCVSCANLHGPRLQHSKDEKRVRRQHLLQVEIPKSKWFAEDRGEIMSEAIWSHFKTILLNELCTTLLDQPTNKVIPIK